MTVISEAASGAAGTGALAVGRGGRPHSLGLLAVAGFLWLVLAALVLVLPDAQEVDRTWLLGLLAAALGGAQLVGWMASRFSVSVGTLNRLAPWLIVLSLWLAVWELVTAKLDLLPLPFFPSPRAFVEVYTDDWQRLGDSLLHSLWLLARGFAIGAALGFALGVALGWSRRVGYWIHPVATGQSVAGDRLLAWQKGLVQW
jgi:NitT/TauT family transport system permease protein